MGHSSMNIEYLRYGIKVTKSVINIQRFIDVLKIIIFELLYEHNGIGHGMNINIDSKTSELHDLKVDIKIQPTKLILENFPFLKPILWYFVYLDHFII